MGCAKMLNKLSKLFDIRIDARSGSWEVECIARNGKGRVIFGPRGDIREAIDWAYDAIARMQVEFGYAEVNGTDFFGKKADHDQTEKA